MTQTVSESYFVLGGSKAGDLRFYASAVAVIPNLGAAMRFITREQAESKLPEAASQARDLRWRVLHVEQTATLAPV
ncbi:hypothetical protein [Phenylobacterium sp.]|jgi:hypothetical protein|uniref:hypothetical protein n=1 Tax=Phenylobacterium sp. TaxID=1871053 RepID=UPI002F9209C6